MTSFLLPPQIRILVDARNSLRVRYATVDLHFTFDGNLVGDLGEAVAAELFNLRLTGRSNEGIDGHMPDGRSVQVKSSGTRRGVAFRQVDTRADHLIVLHFDYDGCRGEVIYNGPEEPVIRTLPPVWSGQRCVSVSTLKRLDKLVSDADRLPMIASDRETNNVL